MFRVFEVKCYVLSVCGSMCVPIANKWTIIPILHANGCAYYTYNDHYCLDNQQCKNDVVFVSMDLAQGRHSIYIHLSLRYIVFLSPYDIGYALCLATPIQLILYIIEEFGRAKKVYSGVTMAAGVYPKSLLAMAVVGMLKG